MLSLCRTAVLLGTMLYLAGCDSIESALKEPADAFFAAVAINDTALAHRYLSASLATRTSVDGLAAFLKHTGLAQARETQWSTSKIEGPVDRSMERSRSMTNHKPYRSGSASSKTI